MPFPFYPISPGSNVTFLICTHTHDDDLGDQIKFEHLELGKKEGKEHCEVSILTKKSVLNHNDQNGCLTPTLSCCSKSAKVLRAALFLLLVVVLILVSDIHFSA